MFYLTTHSTYFIYGYMASDIWLRTILIVRKETHCRHIGYSYRLTERVLLYAPSHRQDNTYHGVEREREREREREGESCIDMCVYILMYYCRSTASGVINGVERERKRERERERERKREKESYIDMCVYILMYYCRSTASGVINGVERERERDRELYRYVCVYINVLLQIDCLGCDKRG